LFSQVGCKKREVGGIAQERSDPLESFYERGEIGVSVALPDFVFGDFYAVTSRKSNGDGWPNRTFEVQVQLSFGKRVDCWQKHGGIHGSKISGVAAVCRH
jgi:hypothetical protein